MKSKTILLLAASISLLATLVSTTALSNQATSITALLQTSPSTATFDMDGVISSLILGIPANTKTIDMTTV